MAETQAGALAQVARTVIETINLTKTIKQSRCMQRGMLTTRFAVDQQQAERAGPEFGTWHGNFLLGLNGQLDDQDKPDQKAG